MSIKNSYSVESIPKHETHDWLLFKHYAKRIPLIIYSFGLFKENVLVGICTFGNPPRALNEGESIFKNSRIKTLELNRLVINDNLEKNVLSFFVSQVIKMLPSPLCLISYADYTFGHNGYIYQATNWLYCGLNQIHERQIFYKGKEVHPRSITAKNIKISELPTLDSNYMLGDYTKKHRYLKIKANKKLKNRLIKDLIYKIKSYPKGNNQRYDASYKPQTQTKLF